MADLSPDARATVDAIYDLTRVTIALHGDFTSKSDAIRRLAELSIPAGRIASILAIPQGDVHSALAKSKKRLDGDRRVDARSTRKKPMPDSRDVHQGEDSNAQG
jgi:hypothetical protein